MPPALHPSRSTLAIATPASPPRNLAAFESGIRYLKSLGFKVKTGILDFPSEGYLSASDDIRAEEFNTFIRDPEVDALFCTRGGYGSLRILPLLDLEAARTRPKLLVGYSDITALQLALYHNAGWTSISGPMVAVEWAHMDAQSEARFWQLASGKTAPNDPYISGEPLKALREGEAAGTLLGGNLTAITRLIGTPFLPSLDGSILFLEDVNEPAYRVDAMLAQLKLCGIWDRLGGLLIGQFTDKEHPKRSAPDIEAVFEEYCNNVTFPVASGLRYGHIPVKNAMPIGIKASLHVNRDRVDLFIVEPLVASRT